MSHILEKSVSELLSSAFNINFQSGSLFGEHNAFHKYAISSNFVNFVEKLEAARKISKQVR